MPAYPFLRTLLFAAAILLASPPARADSAASPSRDEYDGRGTDERRELWVIRVPLYPAYAASDYLVRRPLRAVVRAYESQRDEIEEDGPSVAPSFRYENQFRPWFGVFIGYDRLFARRHDMRMHAAFGGIDALTEAVESRLRTRAGLLSLTEAWTRRGDNVFYGIGPQTGKSARVRYGAQQIEGHLRYERALARFVVFEARVGARRLDFDRSTCCGSDPDLRARARDGALTAPVGFANGYTAVTDRVAVVLDTRPETAAKRRIQPVSFSGVRLALDGEAAYDLAATEAHAWTRFGAEAGAFLDLGRRRIISLSVTSRFSEPLSGSVPFTELASLGGEHPMRALRAGRLLGRSAASATLAYDWPIWVFLGAGVETSVGNVFGSALRGFEPKLLRAASAVRIY